MIGLNNFKLNEILNQHYTMFQKSRSFESWVIHEINVNLNAL